jgi:hypothetical protein
MVLSHGSNGVFCLSDLLFCEFCINEFGVSEAAKFVAYRGETMVAVCGARSMGNDSASSRRGISRSMTGVACAPVVGSVEPTGRANARPMTGSAKHIASAEQ